MGGPGGAAPAASADNTSTTAAPPTTSAPCPSPSYPNATAVGAVDGDPAGHLPRWRRVVIRLGLRLSLAGGRESAVPLAVTAAAVALGVGLLLVTLAGINALHAQDRRAAWLNTSAHNVRPSVDEATTDPVWGLVTLDQFGSKAINRADVAATGPRSPVPPGIPHLPGPGEYYANQ